MKQPNSSRANVSAAHRHGSSLNVSQEMKFECSICGEPHDVKELAWHFREPLPWLLASEAEREHSVLTEEQCELVTHEGMHFFIHALLQIPIKGSDEVFTWGVWCSLSEKSYLEVSENWENPARKGMGPYFGWLCSKIPEYPDTLYLKTHVHQRDVGLRPTVELEQTMHPLAIHQREGLDVAARNQLVSALFHDYEKQSRGYPPENNARDLT